MSDRPEPPARDLIKQQAEEIARLRAELERAERDRDRLQRENERLRKQLDAARRAGFRQAAPFSKGAPVSRPRRPGRKPGRPYGRQGRRAVPPVIDETYAVPLPGTCPECGAAVDGTHVTVQYQEDLPPTRPRVRRFDIHVGRCRGCGRRVQGRHPLQTSDALGAAAVQIGPDAVALSAVLNKQLGLSFGKIATLFVERFGLRVAPSAIVRALHRAAAKALPTYAALVQTVRDSPMVVPDETGWRVRAQLWWLWVFVTPATTVYAILPGRGFEEAASLLGASFAGILVHDGWAPYRRFTEAAHQTCLNHLLERCRELCTDYPRACRVRCKTFFNTHWRFGIATRRAVSPRMAWPWRAVAWPIGSAPCSSNGRPSSTSPGSCGTLIANGMRCSRFCLIPPSTQLPGVRNRRCGAL